MADNLGNLSEGNKVWTTPAFTMKLTQFHLNLPLKRKCEKVWQHPETDLLMTSSRLFFSSSIFRCLGETWSSVSATRNSCDSGKKTKRDDWLTWWTNRWQGLDTDILMKTFGTWNECLLGKPINHNQMCACAVASTSCGPDNSCIFASMLLSSSSHVWFGDASWGWHLGNSHRHIRDMNHTKHVNHLNLCQIMKYHTANLPRWRLLKHSLPRHVLPVPPSANQAKGGMGGSKDDQGHSSCT